MKKTCIIVFVFMSLLTFGQVADDFSDGDFTTHPTWTGNASNFEVADGRLKSNGPNVVNSKIYLQTANTKSSDAEWNFLVDLDFNPTATTFVRVYLVSNQNDLSGSLNGYYIQIGQTNADFIKLFRQDGLMSTELFSGSNSLGTGNILSRIKITRSLTGEWKVFSDNTGGVNYVSEGNSVVDITHQSTLSFGFYCGYATASRYNLYHFDDIYVGNIIVDTTPPTLQSLLVVNQNTLSLVFSEKLEVAAAQNVLNYTVNNSIGHPSAAVLLADGKSVQLTFQLDFTNAVTYSLSVQSIKDQAGNSLSTEKLFQYFIIVSSHAKDVLITEIMADPTPVVQLPEAEYIEIHNRSAYAFDLTGWKLSDAAGVTTLPSALLLPGSFLILASTSNATKFSSDVKALAVTNFPSLNNDGEPMVLKNAAGATIDSVNYASTWYRDDEKKDGGWSLELIDPQQVCGEEDNWTASENETGGTPGKSNSVLASKPDFTGPQLLRVTPITSHQLLFQFNEKLQKPINTSSFLFSPEVKIEKAFFTDLSLRQIQVDLSQELEARHLYSVHVVHVYDCNGNTIQESYSNAPIALPEPADSLDILINEVLFNPRTGGVDFVEVYNQSPKYINLKNAKLANYEDGTVVNAKVITTLDYLIRPADYVVFTSDGIILKNHYPQSDLQKMVITTLPGLPDEEGSIAWISGEGITTDYFRYTEKYHSPLIKEQEGVSLERISFTQPTDDADNWRSATAAAGFATPGFINSNMRPEEQTNAAVQVAPEIFSTQVPGNDFARIHYQFEESGYVANIKIYDQQGRAIKEIVNNATIGYDGVFRWDGDRDDGTKAQSGYYLVWFEAFNTNGSLKTFRKRVIIASR